MLTAGIFSILSLITGLSGCGGGGGGNPPAALPAPSAAEATKAAKITGTAFTQITVLGEEGGKDVLIPLSGADVNCGGATAKTDDAGRFTLMETPGDNSSCTITKTGFNPQSIRINMPGSGTFNADATVLLPKESGTIVIESEIAAEPVSLDGVTAPWLMTGVTISGVSAGAHSVSATSGGFESAASHTVVIKPGSSTPVTLDLTLKTISIDIAWDARPVRVGETLQLSATCEYSGGSEGDCTEKLAWDMSNTGVGTITDRGTFTAAAPGETTVSATRVQSRITHPGVTVNVVCPDGTSWIDGTCTGDTLMSIEAVPAEIHLQKGGSAELSAACVWRIAGAAPCPGLTWTASDPGIASVDASGTVTGNNAGTASVTAAAAGTTSNAVTATVEEIEYPDITCEGSSAFCLDVAGSTAAADSRVVLELNMSNPPASGLGTGIIALVWEPGSLVYESNSAGDRLIGLGKSEIDGRFVFVFTSPTRMTSDTTLFSITFSVPPGTITPVHVAIDQSLEATNFTDFGLNLISQSGIVFRDGYAVP